MTNTATYTERVPASNSFRWALWGSAAVSVTVAVISMAAEGTAAPVSVAVIAGVLLLMFVLDRWFMVLRVAVDRAGVEARFGPFSKRLQAGAIQDAEDERYQWTKYGGWGIRWGFGGRRAWTVPFLKQGVAVALKDGSRYFISSRQPERLRSAIDDLIAPGGGTRG